MRRNCAGGKRPPCGGGTTERGFTVVELAFGMAASVVILLATVGVSNSVSSSSTELITGFEDLRGNIGAIDRLRRDLTRSKIVAIGDHGVSITYALPIRGKEDDSILAEDGAIRWGTSDRRGIRVAGFCKVVFKPDKELVEAIVKRDINGDGDTDDHFFLGRLHRVTDANDQLALHEIRVMLAGDNFGGDVDGDGEPDPLFSLSVNNIVTMRLARPGKSSGVKVRVVKIRPIASEVQR